MPQVAPHTSGIPVTYSKDALDRVRDEQNKERFLAKRLTRKLLSDNQRIS
jgi:hypothetical protein